MSWAVEVLDRDNGRFLNSPEICQPLSLSWDDFSGPARAFVSCPCDHLGLEDWRLRLGQEIRVYDPQGRLAWWGYLHEVILREHDFQHIVSMGTVANRVAVRYNDPNSTLKGEYLQTDWLDELESQSIYGIKELLIKAEHSSKSTAEWTAAVLLHDRALPKIELGPNRKPGSGRTYLLQCRGWLDTLNWRVWRCVASSVSHTPSQLGIQPLGNTPANRKVVQSFRLKDDLGINSLAVRIRKLRNPSDALRMSIQTDLSGAPSGMELGAQAVDANQLSADAYGWVEARLPVPVNMNAGIPYWLVTERSGAINPSDYFLLAVDENVGYQDGQLAIYDQSLSGWKPRSPEADLLFRVSGVVDQVEHLLDVVGYGGQFLRGAETEIDQSLALPPADDQGQTCLQVIRNLLLQGNAVMQPLCSGVDTNRRFQVWKRPESVSAALRLDRQGKLQNRFGHPLAAPWQAVGQWLLSDAADPLYLNNLSYEPIGGKFTYNRKIE